MNALIKGKHYKQAWLIHESFADFDSTEFIISRYGSFYLKSLENIDETHAGAKDEMMKIGISVRRNKYGIGQAVNLAGEQSYMRDAKTSGGITAFQTNKYAVLK